jgi:hypothetical protein
MRRGVAWGLVLVCLLGVSCGDDDDDATSGATSATTAASSGTSASVTTKAGGGSTTVDACALLTAEEVGGFLGKTVVAEPQPAVPGACEWVDPSVGGYEVRVTVGPAREYEILKSKQATDLPGFGDEAWTTHTEGTTGDYDIGVLVGDRHVLVFFTAGLDLEKAKQMTQRVLDELE